MAVSLTTNADRSFKSKIKRACQSSCIQVVVLTTRGLWWNVRLHFYKQDIKMKDSVTKWSEYAANTVMYNKYLSYGIISDQDFISPIPP